MGRVAEEEKPRQRPALEPIADDVEQEGMRDGTALGAEMRGQVGRDVARHLLDPALDAEAAEVAERALVDDPADLQPAVVGGEEEGEVAVAQVDARGGLIQEGGLGGLAPDDIERLLGAPGAETRPRAPGPGAAVGPHDQGAPALPAARAG